MIYLVLRHGKKQLEVRNKKPTDYLGEVPDLLKDEDPRWLQVENINDGDGNLVPTVTIDQPLKDLIVSQDLIANSSSEAAKIIRANERDALLVSLIAFDENQINDIAAIRSFAKDVKDFFLYKYKDDIAKKLAE